MNPPSLTQPHDPSLSNDPGLDEDSKTVALRSKIVLPGFVFRARANQPMETWDNALRAQTLEKINKLCKSNLTIDDLPVHGPNPRVQFVGHKLPEAYQSSLVRDLFPVAPASGVNVVFGPDPDRIIQTQIEVERNLITCKNIEINTAKSQLATTQQLLEATNGELVTTKSCLDAALTELDTTKILLEAATSNVEIMRAELTTVRTELKATSVQRDLLLDQHPEKELKGHVLGTNPVMDALAMMEAKMAERMELKMDEKLKKRDGEWERKMKKRDGEWERKMKKRDREWEETTQALQEELEQEKYERKQGQEKLHQIINPIRLRYLLDEIRGQLLADLPCPSWKELLKHTPVVDYITHHIQSPHRPDEDAIRWLLESKNPRLVRKAGNKAAHKATEEDVRATLLSMPEGSEDKKHLQSWFSYVYNGAQV